MSVKLRKRENLDGTTTLVLDIYKGPGQRKVEFLKHLQLPAGNSIIDRQKRKENRALAQQICIERAQELSASDYDLG